MEPVASTITLHILSWYAGDTKESSACNQSDVSAYNLVVVAAHLSHQQAQVELQRNVPAVLALDAAVALPIAQVRRREEGHASAPGQVVLYMSRSHAHHVHLLPAALGLQNKCAC